MPNWVWDYFNFKFGKGSDTGPNRHLRKRPNLVLYSLFLIEHGVKKKESHRILIFNNLSCQTKQDQEDHWSRSNYIIQRLYSSKKKYIGNNIILIKDLVTKKRTRGPQLYSSISPMPMRGFPYLFSYSCYMDSLNAMLFSLRRWFQIMWITTPFIFNWTNIYPKEITPTCTIVDKSHMFNCEFGMWNPYSDISI